MKRSVEVSFVPHHPLALGLGASSLFRIAAVPASSGAASARVLTVCLLDLHRLEMIAAWAERSRPPGSALLSTVGLVDVLS